MDDRAGEDESEDAGRLAALLAGGRHRWHPAPDDDSLFVLDDGTGDVELRIRPGEGAFQAVLLRRDEEVGRFDVPGDDERDGEAFRAWLDEAVERHAGSHSGENAKNKTRFIVSFGATQIAKLRAAAEREGVPVAEVVRRAVEEYLAGRENSPQSPGRPLG